MASTSSNIKVAIRKAFRQLKYNARRFGGGLECSLVFALFPRWPDCVLLIVCVSANAWMLAFSVFKILLALLSTFSSFSTLWKHALYTRSEGRSSILLPPTLWKSSLTLASTDGKVPRRCRLWVTHNAAAKWTFPNRFHLPLSESAALITLFRDRLLTTWEVLMYSDNFNKSELTVMRP